MKIILENTNRTLNSFTNISDQIWDKQNSEADNQLPRDQDKENRNEQIGDENSIQAPTSREVYVTGKNIGSFSNKDYI